MEGELLELDLTTYECTQLFDLNDELGTDGEMKVHYKDCYTSFGRLVVCSNEYSEPEWAGERSRGRLAEYDGTQWRILREDPFTAIGGRHEFGGTIFATGWDRATPNGFAPAAASSMPSSPRAAAMACSSGPACRRRRNSSNRPTPPIVRPIFPGSNRAAPRFG